MPAERITEYFTATAVFGAVGLLSVAWITNRYRLAPRYPPGPTKLLPWIGSLIYMPGKRGWETYERWGKEYNSDILHLQGAGLNIIVLNSMEATVDLLERRSAIYSSRPAFSFFDMMGWEWALANMPYTPAWRERRRVIRRHLHPSKPEVFQPKFLASIREYLVPKLLENPGNWVDIFQHAIGSATISLTYGVPLQGIHSLPDGVNAGPDDSPYSLDALIRLAEAAVGSFNSAFANGAIIFDLIPALKYLPPWFPGFKLGAKMSEWRRLAKDFRDLPFDVGRSLIAGGKAEESFISGCLDAGEDVDVVRDAAGVFFAGGVETTVGLLHTFIFAMLLHPEVQTRCQQELDQLLAAEERNAPEWDDRDKLPYLAAVLKEVLRWRPVVPLGLPHALIRDDEYKGYHIPKDSIIIPNVWLMLHDTENYGPNTDEFQPERFLDEKRQSLKKDMRDPADAAFGFGRRTCPGMDVALYTFFMVASHVLSVFDIEHVVDENGIAKLPSMDWPNLVSCSPLPFDCKFVPRNKLHSRSDLWRSSRIGHVDATAKNKF